MQQYWHCFEKKRKKNRKFVLLNLKTSKKGKVEVVAKKLSRFDGDHHQLGFRAHPFLNGEMKPGIFLMVE